MFENVKTFLYTYRFYIGGIFIVFILILQAAFIKPPQAFPVGGLVLIEEGMTVRDAANLLEERNIIRSSSFFAFLIETFGDSGGVRSGTYGFEERLTVFAVADRLSRGDFGASLIRVTIPEGATVREMAVLYADAIPGFDAEQFKKLARPEEGYLFPDTYLFAPGTTPETAILTMREQFDAQVATIQEEIDAYGAPLHDVVVMASLLEREARLFETKQIIAGILWKRIDIGMPLQVDAVFGYILDTETFSPTFDQLEIDSPYNTYTNLGLPPGPIASPGLDSLRAAVNPIETPYLYYLTGADGTMHYGRTFEEHKANRRFLR